MQELIKELKELRDHKARLHSTIQSKAINECVKLAEQKLEKEKQAFIDFHIQCMKQGLENEGERKWNEGYLPKITKVATEYYNSLTTPQEGDSK